MDTVEFLTALASIIAIDLILAGDNALLIGLAARNLPKHQQKKVIMFGAIGAVVIRSIATLLVVWLLKIPGLLIAGALFLLFIAYKLLTEQQDDKEVNAKTTLWGAIKTIIIADAAMGIDNVIAVAGAAHGSFLLVVIGLLISIPVVIWGSTLILKLLTRFPSIIYIGAGVLVLTAGKMLFEDPFLHGQLHLPLLAKWGIITLLISAVLLAGYAKNTRSEAYAAAAKEGAE
ncbi:TerC family protein [Bacillus marinisedimentorum]|uniref:TerC family protein n=1 Tax=Bacillus marinisedimentorum TaxID=1821260 RepID=UPI0007E21443|nr:TerC family protein [Bacillus marinisedimentorum]